MKLQMRRSSFLLIVILLLCSATAYAGEVSIAAAASLRETINDLAAGFAKKHPGVRFVKSFGASGALARQLENGAPADIFISANEPWAIYLQKKGVLAPDGLVDFTFNTLVFAGFPETKASSLKDVLKLNRIAIGSPKSVPAGEYAMEALQNAFIAKQLEKKLVTAKDVRESLTYAERGEVDGALVYRTDALQSKKVRILFTVPQRLYERIMYPMSLTAAGARNKDATAFFQYLQGPEAKAVLAKHGFQPS